MRLAAAFIIATIAIPAAVPPMADASSEHDPNYYALRLAYYRMTVAEYCGLATDEVGDGFRRKVRSLKDGIPVPEDVDLKLRISAARQADYEYSDYGLNGYRKWCARVGGAAVADFIEFRERAIAAGGQ